MSLIICIGSTAIDVALLNNLFKSAGIQAVEVLPELNEAVGLLSSNQATDVINDNLEKLTTHSGFLINNSIIAELCKLNDNIVQGIEWLLFYTPPSEALVVNSQELISDEDSNKRLSAWINETQALMTFHKKNSNNSVLININECISNPTLCLDFLSSFTINKKDSTDLVLPTVNNEDLIKKHHAINLLADNDEVLSHYDDMKLYSKLFSSLTELNEKEDKEYSKLYQRIHQKAVQSTTLISEIKSENKNSQNEINQLQEELELNIGNTNTLTNELALAKKALAEKTQIAVQSTERVADIESSNEIALLQIKQLQEELELNVVNYNTLINEFASKTAELSSEKNQLLTRELTLTKQQLIEKEQQLVQSKERVIDIESQNVIALLQINQLQDELEYYYEKTIIQEDTKKEQSLLHIRLQSENIFIHTIIGSMSIIGEYNINGYSDFKIKLHDFTLGDGRFFECISLKFLEVDGELGLEFRPDEFLPENTINWRDEFQDEYGHFIRFIFNPNDNQKEQQQKIYEQLTSSERILILSIGNCLANVFINGNVLVETDISDILLKGWRLKSIALKEQATKFVNWLSFDEVSLNEEYRTEGYEHLWLNFNNLLLGERYFSDFSLKFSVTEISEGDVFADTLSLEFRELENGQAPLQAWPPENSDEYGYKHNVSINLTSEEYNLNGLDTLSDSDKLLINHIVSNFYNIIEKLEHNNIEIERSFEQWKGLGNKIQNLLQNTKNKNEVVVNSEVNEVEDDTNEKSIDSKSVGV